MRSLYDDNIKKFNLWCRDNTSKAINIVFRPYDNLVILNDLIDDYLLKNKKILYIKKFFDVFKFKYNEGVEYITFDTLYSINKFYDLIILDDVSFYSEKRDIEIIEYISDLKSKYPLAIVTREFHKGKNVLVRATEIKSKNNWGRKRSVYKSKNLLYKWVCCGNFIEKFFRRYFELEKL